MITHIKPFIGGQILQGSRQMNQSVKYRQNAAVCYEAVRILTDPRQKAHLLAIARSWISLADQAERNSRIGSHECILA
jgi:hypothetical protein